MALAIINNFQSIMRAKEISIRDAGGSISISFGSSVLLLNKPQISVIEIVKDDTVRIEMGSNNTNSLFIKAGDVVDPVIRDVNDLRDAIQAMLVATAGGGDGDCACAPLIEETNTQLSKVVTAVNEGNNKADANVQNVAAINANGVALNQIVTDNHTATLQKMDSMLLALNQINTSLGSNDYYKEPLRIDDTAPLVVYKGYSAIANLDQNSSGTPVWAIEKVVRNGDMYTYLWANGSKTMTNVWLNRANLNYQPLMAS
jgi:hypothetical protein